MWEAQGQVAARRSRIRRPPRTSRPAALNRRSRSRLGSQARAALSEGEHRRPGQQFAGHGHQLAPELVLVKAVQREVTQPGVFGAADPVLAPGPAAMPQFQVRELPVLGVGGEAGEAVAIDVGEPQLRAGMGAFLADDHPHPFWPAR